MKIEIIRHDDMDAFGAYAAEENAILFNVEANLITSIEEGIDFKELMIETLMHEFGHCLEEKLGLEFNEERIERMVNSYKEKYEV